MLAQKILPENLGPSETKISFFLNITPDFEAKDWQKTEFLLKLKTAAKTLKHTFGGKNSLYTDKQMQHKKNKKWEVLFLSMSCSNSNTKSG